MGLVEAARRAFGLRKAPVTTPDPDIPLARRVAAVRRPPTEDECADWAMELADGKSWADILHAAKHLHDLPREIGRFLARYHRGYPPAANLFSGDPVKRRAFITAAVKNFRAPETDVAAWRSGERAFEDMVSEEVQ